MCPQSWLIDPRNSRPEAVLQRVNPRKALGPDSIPGWALRASADQLEEEFTNVFSLSLSQ